MSLLDIDERLLDLIAIVDFDRSPIDDIKTFNGRCAIGLVEGGCCNDENVHVLRDFRKNCDILLSVGECARTGGIPALRNPIPVRECLEEAFQTGPTVYNPTGMIPNNEEIPLLLNRVVPCHEVVRIDYHIMGCPPSAETMWKVLTALLSNEDVDLPYDLIKYD